MKTASARITTTAITITTPKKKRVSKRSRRMLT
jgi:hypothetical protein